MKQERKCCFLKGYLPPSALRQMFWSILFYKALHFSQRNPRTTFCYHFCHLPCYHQSILLHCLHGPCRPFHTHTTFILRHWPSLNVEVCPVRSANIIYLSQLRGQLQSWWGALSITEIPFTPALVVYLFRGTLIEECPGGLRTICLMNRHTMTHCSVVVSEFFALFSTAF